MCVGSRMRIYSLFSHPPKQPGLDTLIVATSFTSYKWKMFPGSSFQSPQVNSRGSFAEMEFCPMLPSTWQVDGGKVETVADFIFFCSKIAADGDCCHKIKRHLLLGWKAMTNLDSVLKSRDITLPDKGPSSQSYGFSSSHVWMWELDYKESWMLKNWYSSTVVLEKILESLALQGDPTSPSWRKSVLNIHWKDWCWSWNSNTLATWYEKLTHWERLKVGEEGCDKG